MQTRERRCAPFSVSVAPVVRPAHAVAAARAEVAYRAHQACPAPARAVAVVAWWGTVALAVRIRTGRDRRAGAGHTELSGARLADILAEGVAADTIHAVAV